ncbi:MAG TPA: type IV pili twitching motility protein PilT, partial [Telluria sp.]|nr:type IV pili twitching motility protein PilT [Telluria sp.]
ALYNLVKDGKIAQEEALANADSATNLLWLLNNGPEKKPNEESAKPAEDPGASFTEFTLNT